MRPPPLQGAPIETPACNRLARPARARVRIAAWLAPALLAAALGCGDDAPSPTAPSSGPELATAAARTLTFLHVSAGYSHSCGVTTDNLAYCWGYNFFGQLGDGTHTDRPTPVRVAVAQRFVQISVGTSHSCGVTVYNRIFCWGAGYYGALGDGTAVDSRTTPVRVVGGLRFHQVVAANGHTCAVTTDDLAYCWGANTAGQLGDGTRSSPRLAPVRVAGGLRFRQVHAGLNHSCGVTLSDRAYCWGDNSNGRLGSGPPEDFRLTPVRVAGGFSFRRVITGYGHTCAVTPEDRAYCWGENSYGQLGDGTTTTRLTPVPVAGGVRFRQVAAAGEFHTCGVTPDDRAYCWGLNREGQLGDGSTVQHLTPAAVAGGLRFRQVNARRLHTCGATLDDVAYCWGSNDLGQLGDGTTTTRPAPTAVVAASP